METGVAIICLPATSGTSSTGRPDVERRLKWSAGARLVFSAAAGARAPASQSTVQFSGGRSLRVYRRHLAFSGLLHGNGASGEHLYKKQYFQRNTRECVADGYTFIRLAFTHSHQLSRTAIYYRPAVEQRAALRVTACCACYHL